MQYLERSSSVAVAFSACLLLATAPSQASSPVGTISAELGGEQREWQTLAVPSEGTATAQWRDIGGMLMLSIQGHDPQADSILHGVLSIETTLMGSSADANVMSTVFSYFPEGLSGPFYSSDDAGQPGMIDLMQLDTEAGNTQGTFEGVMCRRESMFAEMDLDDCLTLSGRFDAELLQAE